MGFKNSKTVTDKYGKGGNWVTLQQGVPVKVVFLGDELWAPAKFVGKRYEACFPETSGDNISTRFATSVYEGGGDGDPQDKVKYLEGSLSLFNAVGEAFSDPDIDEYNTIWKIEKKSNTEYIVKPVKAISEKLSETLERLERIDLAEHVNWLKGCDADKIRQWNNKEEGGSEPASDESDEEDDDLPF